MAENHPRLQFSAPSRITISFAKLSSFVKNPEKRKLSPFRFFKISTHQDSPHIGSRKVDEIVFGNISRLNQKPEIQRPFVEPFRDVRGAAAVKMVGVV